MKYIQESIQLMKTVKHKSAQVFIGCSDEEIRALEACLPLGYKLPAAYVEFLHVGGHEFGALFWSYMMSYPIVLDFTKTKNDGWAQYVLDDPQKGFDPRVFIFEDGDGLFFSYFNLDEGDDPPIYLFQDPMRRIAEARLASPTFSDYMLTKVKVVELCYNRLPQD